METEKAVENDLSRCEDFLTAEELVGLRKPTEEPSAHVIGSKFYRNTHNEVEEKTVVAAMANFRDTLDKKRATRICDLMQAKWDDQLNASITDKLKGKYVQHMGRSIDGKVALSPEESMFLLENGCIEIINGETPMSTEEGFSVMLKQNLGVEKYIVYSHLAQLGFIVVSHPKESSVTRYEKNLNLDKHQVKRKASLVDTEEPNKKRLTFTGALSGDEKQISPQKEWDISVEDEDSVTECSSMAETEKFSFQTSEKTNESEKENLDVESMDIQIQENIDEQARDSQEMENVDSNSVCSIRDKASSTVCDKNINTETGKEVQMEKETAQACEIESVSKETNQTDNSLPCTELLPENKLPFPSEHSISDGLLSSSELNPKLTSTVELPSTKESNLIDELTSTGEAACINESLSISNEVPSVKSTPKDELPSKSTSNDEVPSKPISKNELSATSEFPLVEELPLNSKTPVDQLSSLSQSVSDNLLTSPSESSVHELSSSKELTPKNLAATSELSATEELASNTKQLPVNDLHLSKMTPKELPSSDELPILDKLASSNSNKLQSNELHPTEKYASTNEQSPISKKPATAEVQFIDDLHLHETTPKELLSTDEFASISEQSPINKQPTTTELEPNNKQTVVDEEPSTSELHTDNNSGSTCNQPATNQSPSISDLKELPSTTTLLSAGDLSFGSQLLFNSEATSTLIGQQSTVQSESLEQVTEIRRNSISMSEKSDIEVMDVDSQSNDVSVSSTDILDKEKQMFGNSINFLASANEAVNTGKSNENGDLDVLSCPSPKSAESDVLSLEADSEDSYPRDDDDYFEGPDNDFGEEDVTLLEVTKKETKPLAVIDLLSEDDENSESDSSDDDDEISVVEVLSAPSGSKDMLSGSVNPKKMCKKEEGISSVPANLNSTAASSPKCIFPVLSRKNVVCVARPSLNLLPNNVQPVKEAYVLEIKPKIDELQPRVWSSYRHMEAYQQMLRHRRQNSDFADSPRTFDSSLQQQPHNRVLLDTPVSNLNSFSPRVDVNSNPLSFPNSYSLPHTSQINSVVSIRQQQNMSVLENHNLPSFPPTFPTSIPLPTLRPGMAPSQIIDQVQRAALSVATNMISYMMNQQQQPHANLNQPPRFNPPPINSYNSYSSVNGQGSNMHPVDVPPYFNGAPPDFRLNDRRHFRKKRHTGKPFPCSYKGASNKRTWDEVKASINFAPEETTVSGSTQLTVPDSLAPESSDGSDIEEVPITPTETLWDSPGVNPLVKPGVKHDPSVVLETLHITQTANLSKCNLNDRCFQESTSLEVSFDVYLPGFNYRKSCPGVPKHRIIVVKASDPVPRYSELAFIQRKFNDGAILQVAFVDNGDISFVSFNSISLPSLIPHES